MLITVDKIEHNYDQVALMNNKKLKCNKTFSMKINLTMRSILKYSICSVFLLNFTHCTNVDEANEPLTNITDHVFQRNSNGITLAWTSPTDTDFSKFLILKNTSPISDSPTTGHDYAGIDLIGSSQMMYNAAAPTFTDTDITAGITYFYKIFAYDVSFNYASGVQLKVDTLAPKVDTLAPSVTIPTSSLIVVEGVAQRYIISLATNALPPSGENVVINLSTNNALLTVNPSQLTLDSSNPLKIVTVTRVNNEIDESDNLMGMISHSLDSSTGASYNIDSVRDAVEHSNITVFMSDDDMAGFIFTPAEVNVTEGMQEDYTVQLSSKPTGDVTLNVNPATGLSGSVASLTFTPFNWGTPQTVSITADDNNYVGDYTTQVNHGVSGDDSKYNSIDLDQVNVNVNIIDADGGTGNVVISTNTLAFDDVDGATGATYTISLSHDPAPGKTVRVSLSENSADLEVSPMVVDFNETTGRSPQTITVTRVAGASGMIPANISVAISHTIATVADYDPNITTFATSGGIVNVTINFTVPKVDADGDGLIDIDTAIKLNNMRYDLAGASYKTKANVLASEPGDSSGCPDSGCNGYELTANIDLKSLLNTGSETAGVVNDMIDTTSVTVGGNTHEVIDITEDASWVPINGFTGTFEGNNHTIANLWVNVKSSTSYAYAGLFGWTSGTTAEIRNVGVTSGSIHSSSSSSRGYSYSGGLVGSGTVTITNSYFSGMGGVSSSSSSSSSESGYSYSGGLVGRQFSHDTSNSLTITNSYFSGGSGVSSSSSSSDSSGYSHSGGLVGGSSALRIVNSYFSGLGGVSSSSSSSSSRSGYSLSGGLVGRQFSHESSAFLTITNSYFSGSGGVSSLSSSGPSYSSGSSFSGGLVGSASSTPSITNGYWITDASQSPHQARGDVAGGVGGLTLAQLMGTMGAYPSGLPHGATNNAKAWDLGTNMQLPAIKLCVPSVDMSVTPPTTDWTTCTSYGDLLAGQRP